MGVVILRKSSKLSDNSDYCAAELIVDSVMDRTTPWPRLLDSVLSLALSLNLNLMPELGRGVHGGEGGVTGLL